MTVNEMMLNIFSNSNFFTRQEPDFFEIGKENWLKFMADNNLVLKGAMGVYSFVVDGAENFTTIEELVAMINDFVPVEVSDE